MKGDEGSSKNAEKKTTVGQQQILEGAIARNTLYARNSKCVHTHTHTHTHTDTDTQTHTCRHTHNDIYSHIKLMILYSAKFLQSKLFTNFAICPKNFSRETFALPK